MKEKDAIAFYKGVIKLSPHLQEDTLHSHKVLAEVYKICYGTTATREHIKLAYGQFNKNIVKRAWDLKQRYIVMLFLQKETITYKEVQSIITSLFNQRTRNSVLFSCADEAERMKKQLTAKQIESWCTQVITEFQSKAKESNVLMGV